MLPLARGKQELARSAGFESEGPELRGTETTVLPLVRDKRELVALGA